MPSNPFNNHTDYGIGIGLRVPHYRHILEKKPVVDWFEIISENFMVDAGRPLEVLDKILEQYRVVQHGVSMYFGSADKPEPRAPQAPQDPGQAHPYPVAFRSSLLGQRRWTLHARLAPHALHLRRRETYRREDSPRPRLCRSPDLRRERQQLRRVPPIRDDRVGVSQRSRRDGRLRNPARCE